MCAHEQYRCIVDRVSCATALASEKSENEEEREVSASFCVINGMCVCVYLLQPISFSYPNYTVMLYVLERGRERYRKQSASFSWGRLHATHSAGGMKRRSDGLRVFLEGELLCSIDCSAMIAVSSRAPTKAANDVSIFETKKASHLEKERKRKHPSSMVCFIYIYIYQLHCHTLITIFVI